MSENINYNYIAKTEDTNDPVIRATLGDSRLTAILDSGHKSINVYHIDSMEKGHMKKMLNDLVSKAPTNRVFFLHPFDDEHKELANKVYDELGLESEVRFEGENVHEVLNNYKETVEIWDGKEIHLLKCIWGP